MMKINLKTMVVIILAFLLAVLLVACGSSGSGNNNGGGDNIIPMTTVSGTVIDINGDPIKVAEVTISSDPIIVNTDNNGNFSVEIEVGDHELLIKFDSIVIYSGTFTCKENTPLNLGNITTLYASQLLGWWESVWSEDSNEIDVVYLKGSNTLSDITSTTTEYGPYGNVIGMQVNILAEGEDIYGREQHINTDISYDFFGSFSPTSSVSNGVFIFPFGEPPDDSLFFRSVNETINYEYNETGTLSNGYYQGTFSGHISTSKDKIESTGSVTGINPVVKDGQLLFTQYIENVSYYDGITLYAETETLITPESEYLGGEWVTVSADYKTTTTFADGSQRETIIVILWQRNEVGTITGKSGNGVVTGSEIINEQTIDYTGSIIIDYGFDLKIGWYKTGYNEKRVAETSLPNRLPFEVISIDDEYL